MKNLLQRYSLWIGLGSLLIAMGAGAGSCGHSIFGAGSSMANKADVAKVQVLEVKLGKVEECLEGMKSRMERMDRKLDRLLERGK